MKWIVIWIVSRLVLVSNEHFDEFGRKVHENEFGLVPRSDTLRREFTDRAAALEFYRRVDANRTPDGSTADQIEAVWIDSIP